MWGALIGLGVDLGKGFFSDYKEGRENKRKVSAAVAAHKIKLAESNQSHNQNWELEQIQGKDSLLRRFSFFMLSMPFMVAIFSPEKVRDYFEVAISAVPEWYQYAYMVILGAIWGVSEFKKWKS